MCVKAHLVVIETHAFYVNGMVGRDSRELCHINPFVVVRQYRSQLSYCLILLFILITFPENHGYF